MLLNCGYNQMAAQPQLHLTSLRSDDQQDEK